jgi:hypothetical protein
MGDIFLPKDFDFGEQVEQPLEHGLDQRPGNAAVEWNSVDRRYFWHRS